MPYKPGSKPIGLTLSGPDYERLKQFAEDHQWSMSQAARLIVRARLDEYDKGDAPSGLIRGARETGADSP